MRENKYLVLSKNTFLKILDKHYAYNKSTDNLYRLDKPAFNFLSALSGAQKIKDAAEKYELTDDTLSFLLKEDLVTTGSKKIKRKIQIGKFPGKDIPPLKYLHVLITKRCNLKCLHCFIEEQKPQDMPISMFGKLLKDFSSIGGLRLIVSGGEPTLHPNFKAINESLKKRTFRSILLTNGITLSSYSKDEINRLNFDEIQLSIDGTKGPHDALRGKGTFKKVIKAAEKISSTTKDLSFATVITAFNIKNFEKLRKIVLSFNPFRWSIDFLCPSGRGSNKRLRPPLSASKLMEHSFNSGTHSSSGSGICGSFLASVLPGGSLVKCDFFEDWIGGNIKEGLIPAWKNLKRMNIGELSCSCKHLESCRGGCRYRALVYNNSLKAPDPVMCELLGAATKANKPPEGGVKNYENKESSS